MTILRTNALLNPSFEVDTSDWLRSDTAIVSLTRDNTKALVGAYSGKMATTAAGYITSGATSMTAAPGQVWTLSANLNGGGTFEVGALFTDGTNTLATALSGTVAGTGAWQRLSVTATAPAGTTNVRLRIYQRATVAQTVWVDASLVEQAATLGTYFDGDTVTAEGRMYEWTGTAHASTSVERTLEADIKVEIAFNDSALAPAPVYTDVTAYVSAIEVKRGRNMELSQFEAGTLNLTLDNTDGRFTPRATPLPGHPTIRPKRPVRVTATFDGTTYPIAAGHIEAWPVRLDSDSVYVTVPAVDAFRILSDIELPNSDTGMYDKTAPAAFWTLQDSDGDLKEASGRAPLRTYWASTADYASFGSGAPTVTYGAASVLPSGNGVALDLGSVYTANGATGSWALYANLDSSVVGSNQQHTINVNFLSALTGWGAQSVVIASVGGSGAIQVQPDGTLRAFGMTVAPAGTIQANTKYQVTVKHYYDPGAGNRCAVACVNGTMYSLATTALPNGAPDGAVVTVGALKDQGLSYYGAGGRYSHVAVWDRALSDAEMQQLWSDYTCGPMMTHARIHRVLDVIGWPSDASGARVIQAANTALVRDSWSDNTSALSLMRKAADSHGGALYMDAQGRVTLKNRYARVNAPVSFTFDSSAATGVEEGIEFVMSEDDIRNVIDLDVTYGIKSRVKDAASVNEFGEKPYGLALAIQDSNEGMDAAKMMLAKYAQPQTRVNGVAIYPSASSSAALWTAALSADIGNRVRLAGLPASAPASQLDYFIESVSHSITRNGAVLSWFTSFDVSPTFDLTAWVVEDSTNGVLDSTTRLTY